MQWLRTSRSLTHLALVWFVLAFGAAVASPLLKPEALTLVCSANGGMKLLANSADSADSDGSDGNDAQPSGQSGHALDCPLCLALDVPLEFASLFAPFESPLAPQLQPTVVAHLAVVAGAPLPPRGPPALG